MEVETFFGYKDVEVGLLLMVGCNTLVLGNLVMVAGGTLGSCAVLALRAMALEGSVGLMMAHKSQIAVLRAAASLADVGMVFCNVRSTSHSARTVRSSAEIVGIAQWLGYKRHVSAMQHCRVVGM
jgi:hypothetical protein